MAAAVGAGALVAAGCGGETLDAGRLEARITTKLRTEGVAVKTMQCPHGRSRKKGDVFECQGSTATGARVAVRVEQQNSSGKVVFEPVSGVVALAHVRDKLGAETEAVAKVKVEVNCDVGTVLAADGQRFSCEVVNTTDPTDTFRITGTVDSSTERGFRVDEP